MLDKKTSCSKNSGLAQNINNENFSSENSKSLSLSPTEEQNAIIHGTLLGDGHIQKRGESYRLKISHTEKHQEYTNWLHSKLESLCQTTQKPTLRISSQGHKSYEFSLTSGSYLKKYHDLYYKAIDKIVTSADGVSKTLTRYQKVLTPELIEQLPDNPYLPAVWFMDDGSVRSDCYSGRIATQGFSKQECVLLKEGYFPKLDLSPSIVLHSRVKQQYTISIPAKQFSKFIEIVEKPIREVPCMVYKLNEINKKE
jgi:hypothetical protein